MNNTVIILFTYNRVDLTESVVSSLKKNINSEQYDLLIYSDGAKSAKDIDGVKAVRNYIAKVQHFKSVKVIHRLENFGLAKSVVSGVSNAFEKYDRVIVLEDDLVLSANFLPFMQQSLDQFEDNQKILNISGFSYSNNVCDDYDNFFWGRATSWGWATWKNRWLEVNWELPFSSVKEVKDATKDFGHYGYDLPRMLVRQYHNEINSWAIQWCFHQHQKELLSVIPAKSKVTNHGFGVGATHCVDERKIDVDFDDSNSAIFNFDLNSAVSRKTYKSYIKNYSIFQTIKNKIIRKIVK